MLRLSGLCKRFEDLPVLSNLSLTLSRGEIVALIGPSGCGKTTLLNIISGLTAPDAGTVEGADGRLSYMFQSARQTAARYLGCASSNHGSFSLNFVIRSK